MENIKNQKLNLLNAVNFARWNESRWGHRPPTRVLFGENVCENERTRSRSGAMRRAHPLDPPGSVSVKECSASSYISDF